LKKILIARPLPKDVTEALKGCEVTVREETAPLSGEEMRAALRDYDGVMPTLGDAFSAEVFADVPEPRCKILANFGVGYNHIDAAAARAAGVEVTNTPGAVTDATADVAMTLMLMSARRAAEGERLVRSGAWAGSGRPSRGAATMGLKCRSAISTAVRKTSIFPPPVSKA